MAADAVTACAPECYGELRMVGASGFELSGTPEHGGDAARTEPAQNGANPQADALPTEHAGNTGGRPEPTESRPAWCTGGACADPGLAAVVNAWPHLQSAVKSGIVALVQAARSTEDAGCYLVASQVRQESRHDRQG
jgi:hypothetical protein